jgi:spore maturation protein CgeB
MKIVVASPGKLKTVPMAGFASSALRTMGHDVIEFNMSSGLGDRFQDLIQGIPKKAHHTLNRRFLKFVDAVRPDLLIAIFGFDITPETSAQIKAWGIPRACWWLNDPFQFPRSLAAASNFDFIFTNSLGSVQDYKENGIPHAYWLPTACDPSLHRPVAPSERYRSEVCFAGDWSPLREEWCIELSRHFDLRIFGPWEKKLPKNSPLLSKLTDGFFSPEQMVSMFSSADLVFNLHSWYGKWGHGTNPRLFEAAGCGSCQVVDWKSEIPTLFDTETEVRTYKNKTDLVACVRDLLDDRVRRNQIANQAKARAHGEHTYKHRMSSLLSTVFSL